MLAERIEITGRSYQEGERAGLEELANRHGVPGIERNTDQYSDIGKKGWWDLKNGLHPALHLLNPTRVGFAAGVFERFKVSKDRPVLEGGSGGGVFAEALARRGYRVMGVDISEGAIKVAREHARQSGLNNLITYKYGSLYALPFPDASFQAAVYPDVLEHLEDLDRAMKEISRVLVVGGVWVFDTIERDEGAVERFMGLEQNGTIPPGTHDPKLFIKPRELAEAARRHGLEIPRDPDNPYGIKILSVAASQRPDEGLNFVLEEIHRDSPPIGHYIGYAIKS